jgi:hypothetical protein
MAASHTEGGTGAVESPGATVIVNDDDPVIVGDPARGTELRPTFPVTTVSVASTVKVKGPGVLGVPVIAPVLAFKVSPPGRLPVVMLYVYGALPPDAVTEELYGTPTCALAFGPLSKSPMAPKHITHAATMSPTTLKERFICIRSLLFSVSNRVYLSAKPGLNYESFVAVLRAPEAEVAQVVTLAAFSDACLTAPR